MGERFLFDQEFDDRGRPRPRAQAQTFGEDELAAARSQAWADGHQAGSAETQQSIDAAAAQALQQVGAQIGDAVRQFGQFSDSWRRDAADIAVRVGRTMAERLMASQPLEEIEGMLTDCISDLHEEPRLVVRASGPIADQIADRIDDIAKAAGFEGHLVVLPDETMSDQDCRVEWAHGGVERNKAAMDAAIDQAVTAYLSAGSAERSQHDV